MSRKNKKPTPAEQAGKETNYVIRVPVERASGCQYYHVKATSEQEAMRKLRAPDGDARVVDEELEVESLGWEDAEVVNVEDDEPPA